MSVLDRRGFLAALALDAAALRLGRAMHFGRGEAIDRRARVDRHAPIVRAFDAWSPLSVGNGGFALTVDATGLQTFPELYHEIPLAIQAEWGWHSFVNANGYSLNDATTPHDAHGRQVPYADAQRGAAGDWLRANPHRLSLARIGLVLRRSDGTPAAPADVHAIEQRLDLWSGTIESRFSVGDRHMRVLTCAHPARDILAFRIESAELDPATLAVRVAFPYAAATHTGDPADWTHPDRHRTRFVQESANTALWDRSLDATAYVVRAAWAPGKIRQEAAHEFRIEPERGASAIELVVSFATADAEAPAPPFADVRAAAEAHWRDFWMSGGAVDLARANDSRAHELERRIVLSEYLTAIQCAGTMPPQETGEAFNSWYGKFHLEMHWWHSAHFALWNRAGLLERSVGWYERILPQARETARLQGYDGVRWPKMVGPDGRESPSGVGVFLIWQQPHPIYLAELIYRARPDRAVLDRYRETVFESATFMASYPYYDSVRRRYVLGPPLIPAQEIHPARTTYNPTFELAYWAFGLETAQQWRERLGLRREARWDRVVANLSALPMRDGLYVNTESAPQTFSDPAQRRDHPMLLGALGFVASPKVDREAMRRTLRRVLSDWQWDDTWGWDYPLVAMTAARLGEPELAVDALLMDTPKNRYLPNGHNYQRPGLTIYLPGNGGLLAATAAMAAGWDDVKRVNAPGFPAAWNVQWETLHRLP
jgi:hypothetical protein